ncbi:TVP38/TMEM64 family protein [Sporobolomyces salmoneus]|uniref:TVP38/TMEM64 family protein n=1 Tax=Sporobolomyces salmoneus TaxID=183962 RepID=UPI0031794B22
MSTPNLPTLKTLIDSPHRPASTGPSSQPDPSTLASSSSSSHPSVSPKSSHVARPSAFSIRNEYSKVQTRIRARSINSGKGVSVPTNLPQLEPTIAGSPVLPNFDSFLQQQQSTTGNQDETRVGAEGGGSSRMGPVRSGQENWSSREGDIDDYELNRSGTETGSTRSDSPLQTPRDSDLETEEVPRFRLEGPSRRGSSAEREERELWKSKGEAEEDLKTVEGRSRSKSLEGMTRIGLRRGRSFTSLLNQPPTLSSPKFERNKELYQPPNPILETYDEIESKPPSPEPIAPFQPPPPSSSSFTTLYPPTSLTDSTEIPPLSIESKKSLRDFVPQLIILVALFFSSFAVIFFFISTLPGLFLPHSVADLPALTATLSTYRASSFIAELHLFGVLTVLFLWKQCFSIPGSVLTNILFGALYGTTMGTWWACLWTATGSTGAYLIALVIAPLVEYYFATPLAMTRRALKLPDSTSAPPPGSPAVVPISSSDLFSHLLLARFFPLLPYSVLNVISGVLRLPLSPFFITLLIGSFPFNFATVSIGNLVALAASDPSTPLGDKIWSKEVVLKLVAVTLISVLPLAFKEQLKRILSNGGLIEKTKDSISRMLFGFGSVPSTSTVHLPAYPSGGGSVTTNGGGGGRRGWQRKFKASIGSASEFVSQGFMQHLGPGRRNAYERVASDVGLPLANFAEGEDDAELGGVHAR